MSIQTILERIDRGCVNDMLMETIPYTDNPLAEEVFPGVKTASVKIVHRVVIYIASRLNPQETIQ